MNWSSVSRVCQQGREGKGSRNMRNQENNINLTSVQVFPSISLIYTSSVGFQIYCEEIKAAQGQQDAASFPPLVGGN